LSPVQAMSPQHHDVEETLSSNSAIDPSQFAQATFRECVFSNPGSRNTSSVFSSSLTVVYRLLDLHPHRIIIIDGMSIAECRDLFLQHLFRGQCYFSGLKGKFRAHPDHVPEWLSCRTLL
jgi:hypothetical protein